MFKVKIKKFKLIKTELKKKKNIFIYIILITIRVAHSLVIMRIFLYNVVYYNRII